MNPIELLREQFKSHIDLREKRSGVLQIVAPLFHEDGDMMDIFLDMPKNDATAHHRTSGSAITVSHSCACLTCSISTRPTRREYSAAFWLRTVSVRRTASFS